jgi:hypothetical protein
MPLTAKGNKIMQNMKQEYGPKKGESVFYASRNAGKISGVDPTTIPPHPTVHKAMRKAGHTNG